MRLAMAMRASSLVSYLVGSALWCTAELKAARDLLVKEHLRTKREAYKATKDVTALNTLREHIQQLNNLPVREESLGTDNHGRRFWYFPSDGGTKLWVEAPKGSPWQWAAYKSANAIKRLITTLEEGSALRVSLEQQLPLITRGMPDAVLAEDAMEDGEVKEEEGGEGGEEEVDLWSLKKDDLKEKCREMGLAIGGNNEALIARIREATGADLYELKKEELKERCRAKGLAVGGNNETLIERLKEAMGLAEEEEEEVVRSLVRGSRWRRTRRRRRRVRRRRRRRTCGRSRLRS